MKGYIVCPCLPERYIFIPLKEKFMLDVGCVLGYKRPSVNEVYSFIRELFWNSVQKYKSIQCQ